MGLSGYVCPVCGVDDNTLAEVNKLKAENEKLKALIKEELDGFEDVNEFDDWQKKARQVLGE